MIAPEKTEEGADHVRIALLADTLTTDKSLGGSETSVNIFNNLCVPVAYTGF